MSGASAAFMSEALKQARLAARKQEVPVGAVIVHEGRIVARGHNLREARQSVLAHAELVALAKACRKLGSWRLPGCDVYVTLEPCPMCAGALQQARVRHVYYGAADPKAGVETLGINIHGHPRLNHRFSLERQDEPECARILTEFFRARRKRRTP